MITLTKIDSRPITVNADEIESVETLHDTTVSLKSGKKIIVSESSEDIVEMVINYRRKCFNSYFNENDYKEDLLQ